MAPLSSSFNGLSTRAEGFISSFIAKVYDGFARITTGSLGTATLGQVWVQNNGVWTSNNGVAVTLTVASNYPYATVPFKTNGTISAQSVSQGAGVVFWQSGANDWWAATTSGTSSTYISSYTCNANSCCTGSNNCVSNACCTGSNNCTYSATCGAGATPDVYYAGKYDACCTTVNTCAPSNSCGSSYFTGTPSDCCTGSNNCIEGYNCIPGQVGASYYPGTYKPCCYRLGTYGHPCVESATCGASYYAGTYSLCAIYEYLPCATGSNNCQADPNCNQSYYGGTYDPCCSGSYAACQSSTTCGTSFTLGSYYSGAPNTCCTGSNNCQSSACCTGSNNCASNNCCTQTANYSTSWNWVLNIIKSVSGTVSNVANSVLATSYSNTNGIKGIKVTTSGTGVSAQGYSDNALTTTVGSPVTATAPSKPTGTGVGIIITPGGTNQGNSVGPFTAQ